MLNKDELKRKENFNGLNKEIKSCKIKLAQAKKEYESLASELTILRSKSQPKTEDVLSNPESYITFEVKIAKYYRLVASHRHASYSYQQVDGNVAFVKVKKEYFLTEIQKELIKAYMLSVYDIQDCKFIF